MPRRRPAFLVRLWRDRRGAVLIYVTLTVGVMFGLGGLAIDGARLYGVHTEMQSFADHVALAAAGELDGNDDAWDRANSAVEDLITDTQTFAGDPPALAISDVRFFTTIPSDEQVAACGRIPDDWPEAATPEATNFVEVTVETREVGLSLLRGLTVVTGDEIDDPTTCASATAGFTQVICNVPPLMFCNPYETADNKAFTPIIGQQILAYYTGQGGTYQPGNFGLLNVPGTSGADEIRRNMARINPGIEVPCIEPVVDTQPGGAVGPTRQGLNVRFDIYEGAAAQAFKGNDNYRPARNVTKGQVTTVNGNQCDLSDPPPPPDDTVRLPRDPCLEEGATPCSPNSRFGDVVTHAQLRAYWDINNPDFDYPDGATTRYDVYRHEIDTPGAIPNKQAEGGENGNPLCSGPGVYPVGADRRVLVVAVINCQQQNIQGNNEDVPVIAFGRMFLTEPVGSPPDSEIYVEMLGLVDPGADDGILHEFPQLYR